MRFPLVVLLAALAAACGGKTGAKGAADAGSQDASAAGGKDASVAQDASTVQDAAPLGADAACVPLPGCSSQTECAQGGFTFGCRDGSWWACLQVNAPGAQYGSCGDAGAEVCPASAPQNGQGCDADAGAACAYPLPPTGACRAWECDCVVLSTQLLGSGPGAWLCRERSCVFDAGPDPCPDAGVAESLPCAEEGLVCSPENLPGIPTACLCANGRWACDFDAGP